MARDRDSRSVREQTIDLAIGCAVAVILCIGLAAWAPEATIWGYVLVGFIGLLVGHGAAMKSRIRRRQAYEH